MKTTFQSTTHLTGDQAYLVFWICVYDLQVRLSTVIALHENLEVIVSDEGDLLAYRYDNPSDLKDLVKGDGEWIFQKSGVLLEL
jgi:hypothetical protein